MIYEVSTLGYIRVRVRVRGIPRHDGLRGAYVRVGVRVRAGVRVRVIPRHDDLRGASVSKLL